METASEENDDDPNGRRRQRPKNPVALGLLKHRAPERPGQQAGNPTGCCYVRPERYSSCGCLAGRSARSSNICWCCRWLIVDLRAGVRYLVVETGPMRRRYLLPLPRGARIERAVEESS